MSIASESQYQKNIKGDDNTIDELNRFGAVVAERQRKLRESDGVVLSWYSVANDVWTWIMQHTGAPRVFPPPIELVARGPKMKNSDAGAYFTTCEFIHGWHISKNIDDGEIKGMIPVVYKVNIYQNNFLSLIKHMWGKHIPSTVVRVLMEHAVMHEFGHYLSAVEWFARAYNSTSRLEYVESIDDLNRYLDASGTMEDEIENEAWTLRMLKLKLYGECLDRPGFLTPSIGGGFARMMERRNEEFWLINGALEMEYHMNSYCIEPEQFWVENIVDDGAVMTDLIRAQSRYAKRNPERWDIVS